MPTITCQCGAEKSFRPAEIARGRKYCSDECARRFRVYAVKDDPLSEKVTVTMTKAMRAELEANAALEGVLITDLSRGYLAEGLRKNA